MDQDELYGDLRAEIATLHDEIRATRKACDSLKRFFSMQNDVNERIFAALELILDQLEDPEE